MAEFTDGGVDAVFGIDEDLGRPEASGDLLARDELTVAFGEQDEQLQRLTLDAHGVAITEELERAAVKPEVAELIDKAAQGILLRGGVWLSVSGNSQI